MFRELLWDLNETIYTMLCTVSSSLGTLLLWCHLQGFWLPLSTMVGKQVSIAHEIFWERERPYGHNFSYGILLQLFDLLLVNVVNLLLGLADKLYHRDERTETTQLCTGPGTILGFRHPLGVFEYSPVAGKLIISSSF